MLTPNNNTDSAVDIKLYFFFFFCLEGQNILLTFAQLITINMQQSKRGREDTTSHRVGVFLFFCLICLAFDALPYQIYFCVPTAPYSINEGNLSFKHHWVHLSL